MRILPGLRGWPVTGHPRSFSRAASGTYGGGADVPDGSRVIADQVGEQHAGEVLRGDQDAIGIVLVEALAQAADALRVLAADPGLKRRPQVRRRDAGRGAFPVNSVPTGVSSTIDGAGR
jgi:hypothetical protein